MIRVGVEVGIPSAVISGQGIAASASGKRFAVPSSFTAQAHGANVVIHGKSYASPVILTSTQPIRCGKTAYEGEIVLRAQGGRLTVVNKLDVEKYLRGVLGIEISPLWALEVLKAQAVISRTYVLSQMGRHSSQGFDVCDTDHCQVYRGVNIHGATTDQAVIQTRGQVVTYRGALARTFFSSDSGGATSDIRDVWGKPEPYLVVRREPYPSQSPKAEWEATVTAAEIQNALAKKGKSVGTLREMGIIQRDAAGRPTMLRFTGSAGTSTLTSAEFRMLIGARKVRSTFFEFSRAGTSNSSAEQRVSALRSVEQRKPAPRATAGAPLNAEEKEHLRALIAQKKFTVDERLDMLMYPERERFYLNKALGTVQDKTIVPPEPEKRPAPPQADVEENKPVRASAGVTSVTVAGAVSLYGRGWGHGVGLSQWGAKAMADHGWSAEKILNFYYPGTVIQRR